MISVRVHRALLRLLPRRRREQYGAAMTQLFLALCEQEQRRRGTAAVGLLWMREAAGIGRFALRDRVSALTGWWLRRSSRGPRWIDDAKWAWRGLRARGGAGLLSIGLLAVVFAVNALVFSLTDSLVFNRSPYPNAQQIVVLSHAVNSPERIDATHVAALVEQWRRQEDLVAAVGGYLVKGGVFLTGNNTFEKTVTVDLTVEALDVLGVAPRWGRRFTNDDLRAPGALPVLVSESFARQRFGRPALALGQRLDATGLPLVVVGVMSGEFAFPHTGVQIWRGIDPAGPMTRSGGGIRTLVRLAGSLAPDTAQAILGERAPRVGSLAGLSTYTVLVAPQQTSLGGQRRTMIFVLAGAAVCLLLVACANVASIELAHAVRRTRAFALHAALGASRLHICRVVALEGALLIATALAAGLALASVLFTPLVGSLPRAVTLGLENPINLDRRVMGFTVAAGSLAWLLAVVPSVVASSRPRLLSLISSGGRMESGRTTTRLRQVLTIAQVAVAVVLVIGGLLYVRSYRDLLRLDRGFDTTGLATVDVTFPPNAFGSSGDRAAFTSRLLTELRRVPGVDAASGSSAPPSTGDSPTRLELAVDGQSIGSEQIGLGYKWVDLEYFAVTRLPLREGRYLQSGDTGTDVVITETFARRFWPGRTAIGGTFRGPDRTWFAQPHRVVGVVGDFRIAPRNMPAVTDLSYYVYALQPPTPTARPRPTTATPGPRPVDSGSSYMFSAALVRMRSIDVLPEVLAAAKRADPRFTPTVTLVDDDYADQHADVLLATRVVTGFGIVAFLVAMAGLYGVTAFLVAARTREIGIRMALGATARDVTQLVLASSGRLVIGGAFLGVTGAVWASKWIESQLFGVSPTDPWTYLGVATAVVATAGLATWRPAHRAARVNPALTLRAD